jgi:hypothetical protein
MKAIRNPAKKRPTVGERIIEGLEQAVAWTRGKSDRVRVTLVEGPDVNVRDVRQRMGLSQAQFPRAFHRSRPCSGTLASFRSRNRRPSPWRPKN